MRGSRIVLLCVTLIATVESRRVWEATQANGFRSYVANPHDNCSVFSASFFSALQEFIDLDGLVIDVGCGPTHIPDYVPDGYPSYVGVEPIPFIGERGGVPIVRATAENLPFRTAIADRVLFISSLDHMIDAQAALAEARRVLKPSGKLFVMTHDPHPSEDFTAHGLPYRVWRRLKTSGVKGLWSAIIHRKPTLQVDHVLGAANPYHTKFIGMELCTSMLLLAGFQVQRTRSLPSGLHFLAAS